MATILFADNDPDFLETRREYLEQEGYSIVSASNPAEARIQLEQGRVDLAILDIRMVDDDDEMDVSGLTLAKDPTHRSVAKIMLTGFPSVQAVREALGPAVDGLPPSVDFAAKEEGPKAMLDAVNKAFAQVVRTNWSLIFTSRGAGLFGEIAIRVLGRELSKDELDNKAQELEKLCRKLFYDYDKANLEIVETKRHGQALIWAHLRKGDKMMPPRLVKIGRLEDVLAEKQAYDDNNKGQLVRRWMVRHENVETSTHFGAIESSGVGFNLEKAKWLVECFTWLTATEFNLVLDDLFENKISKCLYEQPCPPEPNKPLGLVYQESLGYRESERLMEGFQQAIKEIVDYMQSQYMVGVKIDRKRHRLSFVFPNGQELSCSDSISYAYKLANSFGPPVLRHISLGGMDGYNVLVDQDKKTWLTEFKTIAPAPNLNDFVTLESKIRFEWISTATLDWNQIYEFEAVFTPPTFKSLEESMQEKQLGISDLDKALTVIAHLRKLAAKSFGSDLREYQLGLLFQAIGIMVSGDATSDRKAHALLAAAMISQAMEKLD